MGAPPDERMSRALISIVLPVQDEGAEFPDGRSRLACALEGYEHEILACRGVDAERTLAAAQGDVVLVLDPRLDAPLGEIASLVERVRAGADVAAGTASAPEGWRSRAGRLALRAFAGLRVENPPGGFCAYSRAFLNETRGQLPERAGEALERQPWFWRALAPGLGTALAFLGCVLAASWLAGRAGDARLAAMLVVLRALGCACTLGFTLWVRGRTSRWDALQPVLWLLLAGSLGDVLTPALSLALALATSGRDALRRRFADEGAPGRRFLRQETLGLAALGLVLWLRHCELPQNIVNDKLDTSWTAALGHFLVTGKHAGTDWMFTSGPLAGLSSPVFQSESFWWKLVLWEGLWRGCTVVCLVLAACRIQGRFERSLCFLALLVPTVYLDAYALATLVAGAVLLDEPKEKRSTPVEALVLLALSGMALAKFTLLVGLLGLAGCLALARGLREGRAAGLRLAGATAAVLALVWFLCGQGLANILPYLQSSWQIASTYSEAQSSPVADPVWRDLGLACVALFALALAWRVAAGGATRAKAASALGLSFVLFCAWKTGFVRAADHTPFFFCFVAPGLLLLPRPETRGLPRAAGATLLRLAAFTLACTGIVKTDPSRTGLFSVFEDMKEAPMRVYHTLRLVSDPAELKRDLERQTSAQRESLALPKVAARVGQETIDMQGFHQGLLLLAQMNWTPRPAFQSYITFTPWLQQQNADFLAGPRAPRYLLARVETIDERWPMMDDALALEEISRRYAPLFMERDYLLLERRSEPRPQAQREVVLDRSLKFGEELVLPSAAPGCAQVLTLELEYTPLGRLVRLLDSTPELRMRLKREDGAVLNNRIVPATMRSRVLIDPLVAVPGDWLRWMLGRKLERCKSLTVDAPRGAPWMMMPEFRVHLESVRDLQPPEATAVAMRDWMDDTFDPRPDENLTPLQPIRTQVGERDVAVVHAPSRFVWRLVPGRYKLTGWYGMLPDTWEHDQIDGADFVVSTKTDKGRETTLLSRSFRPAQTEAEHEMQRMELEFAQGERGRLLLTTNVGPGRNSACDWCFWSDVKLVRLPDDPPPR
jgi:hypothetical protein